MRIALINGSPDGALSPWDRGLLYGDGVFETMRAYRGQIFALDEHLSLLARTATTLGLEASSSCALLASESRGLVAKAGGGDLVVRVLLTRGEGSGAALTPCETPTRVVLVEPLLALPDSVYRDGVSVETRPLAAGALGPKTTSYLPHLRALHEARSRGHGEVLWRDEQGALGQGSTSNLLLLSGGALIAPCPPGGRAGVTRGWLLGQARAWGWSVIERPTTPQDLAAASELLLCSTLREVVPVVAIDGQPVGSGQPGPAGRALREALRHAAERGRGGA